VAPAGLSTFETADRPCIFTARLFDVEVTELAPRSDNFAHEFGQDVVPNQDGDAVYCWQSVTNWKKYSRPEYQQLYAAFVLADVCESTPANQIREHGQAA
jgi:hypothetical protein